jgi:hypothetical protein
VLFEPYTIVAFQLVTGAVQSNQEIFSSISSAKVSVRKSEEVLF